MFDIFLFMNSKKIRLINISILLITLLLIFISDTLLLFRFGLPIGEWDHELHYKHRNNISTFWENENSKPLTTNSHGFHDDEFPLKKKKRELRILNLGDSITMGLHVNKDSTYSAYMEKILKFSLNFTYHKKIYIKQN
ncbi:MAG: hypothetical protein IPH62_11570 [Ignavibacteriae bacterium]|nr:hypothetical protein [Ignavibacteriota bacterium]